MTLGVGRAGFLSGGYRDEPVCLSSYRRPPTFHLQSNKLAIGDIFISGIPLATTRKGYPPLIAQ